MVRSFTTVRPPKDFVSPSTSMTISGAPRRMAASICAATGQSITALGRRRPDAHRQADRQVHRRGRPRLDTEHELCPLLLAEDHRRRVLGLARDEADLGLEPRRTAVAGDGDGLPEREGREHGLGHVEAQAQVLRRQQREHRLAGIHDLAGAEEHVLHLGVRRRGARGAWRAASRPAPPQPRPRAAPLRRRRSRPERPASCAASIARCASSRAAWSRSKRRLGVVELRLGRDAALEQRLLALVLVPRELELAPSPAPPGRAARRSAPAAACAALRFASCASAWRSRASASFFCADLHRRIRARTGAGPPGRRPPPRPPCFSMRPPSSGAM